MYTDEASTRIEEVPEDCIDGELIIATTSVPVHTETTNELFSRVTANDLRFHSAIFPDHEKYNPGPYRIGKIEIFKRTLKEPASLTDNYLEPSDYWERNIAEYVFDNAGNIHYLGDGMLLDTIISGSVREQPDPFNIEWTYAAFMNAFSSDLINSSVLLKRALHQMSENRELYEEHNCKVYAKGYSELRAARVVYQKDLQVISSMWDGDENITSHKCVHDVCEMYNGTVYKLYNFGTILFFMDEYYKSFMKKFPKN